MLVLHASPAQNRRVQDTRENQQSNRSKVEQVSTGALSNTKRSFESEKENNVFAGSIEKLDSMATMVRDPDLQANLRKQELEKLYSMVSDVDQLNRMVRNSDLQAKFRKQEVEILKIADALSSKGQSQNNAQENISLLRASGKQLAQIASDVESYANKIEGNAMLKLAFTAQAQEIMDLAIYMSVVN